MNILTSPLYMVRVVSPSSVSEAFPSTVTIEVPSVVVFATRNVKSAPSVAAAVRFKVRVALQRM